MKLIPLTQGKFAKVDDEDYNDLSRHKWRLCSNRYAGRLSKTIYMHRVVAKTPPGMDTDHINGDTLDNRRSNLRTCSATENQRNRSKNSSNKSGYKGVSWNINAGKWRATITVNRKNIHIGYFATAELAAQAYDDAAQKHGGEFARLNLRPAA